MTVASAAPAGALRICRAGPEQLAAINARYAQVDFLPSTDQHLIALALAGDQMVGVGRIVPIADGIGELGGMYVFDGWQGRGLARQIIAALRAWSPQAWLYCIPFSELASWYQSMGFLPVSEGTALPPAIEGKLRWSERHYAKPVSLLRWQRAP